MTPSAPHLTVHFTYDHAAGIYYAHLENGSVIPCGRGDIEGRLANALRLFAKGVVATEGGKWRKPPAKPDFDYSYDEANVQKFSERGIPEITLEDLEL